MQLTAAAANLRCRTDSKMAQKDILCVLGLELEREREIKNNDKNKEYKRQFDCMHNLIDKIREKLKVLRNWGFRFESDVVLNG